MSSTSSDNNDLLSTILSHIDERLDAKELTLSQCVRRLFNTKQRPSRLVAKLLPLADRIALQDAYKVILEHVSMVSAGSPCLLSIKVFATVIVFLQLVLESMTKIGDTECLEMAASLIQSMQKSICAISQDNVVLDESDIVPQNEQHAPSLAGFFLGAMLRSINPYVSSIPVLLSPLWKSLCDVALRATHVPNECLKASILALLVYLKEGERPCLRSAASFIESLEQSLTLPQHVFHSKVMSFLVTRLAALLTVYINGSEEDDEMESVLSDIFSALVRVRGITKALEISSATHVPPQVLQSYKSVDKKIDQCVLKVLVIKQKLNQAAVKTFVALKVSQKPCFESRCSRFGKLSMLQMTLQNTPVDSSSAESLLLVAEQAIFSVLPKSSTELLVGGKCFLDSSILLVAVSAAVHLDPKSGFHVRLMLIRWLSRGLHPIAREAVVTIVHNYVMALTCIATRGGSPRSSIATHEKRLEGPMVTLMSNLLFDLRTATSHRENIASVLHRLLCSPDCPGLTRSVLLGEAFVFLKTLHARAPTKQKQSGIGIALTLTDWNCILDVVACLDFSSDEGLQREVLSFTDDVGSRDDSIKATRIFYLKGRPPLEVALLVAGAPHQLAIRLMGWFLTQTQRRKGSALLTTNGTILTCSMLRFLGRSLQHSPDVPLVGPVAKFLSWTVAQTRQLLSNHRDEHGAALALATGDVLRRVGYATSPSTPAEVLKQISSSFNSLLSLSLWPMSANTMTCLTEFASVIPKTHQDVLTSCLPIESQGLFTCRLQSKVHRGKTAHQGEEFEIAQIASTQRVMKLIPTMPPKSTPFAASAAYTLAPGSFLLSMPTVEGSGRSAIVIFPPGEQSLHDIKHMLQKDKIEGDDVRQLHRVQLSGNGGGCRLYSEQFR
jgi:hypothetical protein